MGEPNEVDERVEILQDLLDYALAVCPVESGIASEHEITAERVEELRDRAAEIIAGAGTQEEREILMDILSFSLEACSLEAIPSQHEITVGKLKELIALLREGPGHSG